MFNFVGVKPEMMKLLFTGTDSLMLNDLSMRKWSKRPYWWLFRLFIRIADRYFVQSHFCNSERVRTNLVKFGLTKRVDLIDTPIKYDKKLPKQPHKGFNILYYFPNGGDSLFNKWLYGFDLFEQLLTKLNVNFIVVDGSQDLSKIYQIVDFYLRPNRHDGNSRMVRECEIQEIPYYWTDENPSADDAIEMITKAIMKCTK